MICRPEILLCGAYQFEVGAGGYPLFALGVRPDNHSAPVRAMFTLNSGDGQAVRPRDSLCRCRGSCHARGRYCAL